MQLLRLPGSHALKSARTLGARCCNRDLTGMLLASWRSTHLMNAIISSSLRMARPMPAGRDARVTHGSCPPESHREGAESAPR